MAIRLAKITSSHFHGRLASFFKRNHQKSQILEILTQVKHICAFHLPSFPNLHSEKKQGKSISILGVYATVKSTVSVEWLYDMYFSSQWKVKVFWVLHVQHITIVGIFG